MCYSPIFKKSMCILLEEPKTLCLTGLSLHLMVDSLEQYKTKKDTKDIMHIAACFSDNFSKDFKNPRVFSRNFTQDRMLSPGISKNVSSANQAESLKILKLPTELQRKTKQSGVSSRILRISGDYFIS